MLKINLKILKQIMQETKNKKRNLSVENKILETK